MQLDSVHHHNLCGTDHQTRQQKMGTHKQLACKLGVTGAAVIEAVIEALHL